MRDALFEGALRLAPLIVGEGQGVFKILYHLRRDKKRGHVTVVGEGDGLAAVGGATDEVAELGAGYADRNLSHMPIIPQD